MASPFKDNINSKLLLDHVDTYSRARRACAQQLSSIFTDLELDTDEQRAELDQICTRAAGVWTQAVEEATCRRNELRQRIEDALREVQKIKLQLGDDAIQTEIDSEVAQLQVGRGWRASTAPRAGCPPRGRRACPGFWPISGAEARSSLRRPP